MIRIYCFLKADCSLVIVLRVPLDEVIDEVFDSFLQLRFLHGNGVTLVGDLQDQLPQFVQLPLHLE